VVGVCVCASEIVLADLSQTALLLAVRYLRWVSVRGAPSPLPHHLLSGAVSSLTAWHCPPLDASLTPRSFHSLLSPTHRLSDLSQLFTYTFARTASSRACGCAYVFVAEHGEGGGDGGGGGNGGGGDGGGGGVAVGAAVVGDTVVGEVVVTVGETVVGELVVTVGEVVVTVGDTVVGEVVGDTVVGETVVGDHVWPVIVGVTVVGDTVGQSVRKAVPVVRYVCPRLRGTMPPHSPALLKTVLHRRTQQPVSAVGVDTIAAPGLRSWETLPWLHSSTPRAHPLLCLTDDRHCKATSPTARRSAVLHSVSVHWI
jgi:hypothetical protein